MIVKKLKGHDHSGTRGRRTRYATVSCFIHGIQERSMPVGIKSVCVPVPRTKRERLSGCPVCRRESK